MPPFQPAYWLSNPHLQTLWSPLLRNTPEIPRSRERLELPDNDFLDLDWYLTSKEKNSPLLVLFHGLTGSTSSPYILGMQQAVSAQGWQSVGVNFRGCSGRPNRLPRAYHSGDTGDIGFVLQRCRELYPARKIFAIGYSLGGNALCKWLGEQGEKSCIDAAVIVSAPYQLDRCATRLDQGFSKVYRRHLIDELIQYIELKKSLFRRLNQCEYLKTLESLGPLEKIRSFWEFDDQVIAPLHGFESAADYYKRSSARQFVPGIRTPTLLVHSIDDPFMPKDVTPEPGECPEGVELVITPGGGHVGFVMGAGLPWKAEYWLEKHIPQWLSLYTSD